MGLSHVQEAPSFWIWLTVGNDAVVAAAAVIVVVVETTGASAML